MAVTSTLAASLGFSNKDLQDPAFLALVAGQESAIGFTPYAQCYGGHQFGHWAGQLGDGRAINVLEILDRRGQAQVLQLKGAGPTPYSRHADGFAVLRSSVREFLCSEAMFHLGIATTRALSLVTTGETVVRDMFYDGHPKAEPGAIVCRVAPTFLRLGSFELFAARDEHDMLKTLVQYTLQAHFPGIRESGRDGVIALFHEVCQRTARLVCEWARVGFVHGVMNTDNLSVLGLTIDYGPYGWLENYDPDWTPNTTDAQGRRYRFGQQAQVALWNLVQFANALYPLVAEAAPFEDALEQYQQRHEKLFLEMMAGKLGLNTVQDGDERLVTDLQDALVLTETDMTLLFRQLALVNREDSPGDALSHLLPAFYDEQPPAAVHAVWQDWLARYLARLGQQDVADGNRRQAMNATNPLYVLRNWLAQEAIDKAAAGDLSGIEELQRVLAKPYEEQPGCDHLAKKRPEWARHRAGCSMLSCSS